MKISYKKMAPARKGTLLGLAVVAALYSAPGAAAGNVDTGVGGTVTTTGPADQVTVTAPLTVVTGNLQVGTITSVSTPVVVAGTGVAGLLPYVVDNGDGTSSVYTVTEQDGTETTTTTTVDTGGVTVGADGTITTNIGSTAVQTDVNTIDYATRVIIDNTTGLVVDLDPRNAFRVAGTYNSTDRTFVDNGGTLVPGIPDIIYAPGGNLNVAGATTLGGAVDMTGNQINNLADGVLATDAANVGQVTAAVVAEAADRAAADNTLQNNINAEASTRAAADTAEAATRSAADITLQNNINAEASTRAAAVTAEATTRAAADTTLQTNITNEATARIAGDNALATRLNTTDARVGSLEGRVGVLEKDVKEVRAGVAMAMAIASIPTVDYGKFALGLGVGTFGGETAVAGAVDIKATERSKFRLAVSNAGGQTGGSAGFSVGF